jgi:acetolactate synthase-1/2/3 large subunit
MNSAALADVAMSVLADTGCQFLFGVPGGGNNLDMVGAAEARGMRFVLTHTEVAAAYMAAAYAQLDDVVASFIATRGPGAASAVNGVAHAWLDRRPVIALTDTVSSVEAARISHQRLDQRALFAPITNWSAVLGGSGGDATATMMAAINAARGPRPGPVHLDFDPAAAATTPPARASACSGADAGELEQAVKYISRAMHPVVVVGIGARGYPGQVRRLVRGTGIPVLHTYNANGVVPDSWPNSAGLFTGATMEAPILDAADLILMLGVDTAELIPNPWPYQAPVVSIAEWPEDAPYFTAAVEVTGRLADSLSGLPAPLPDAWPPSLGSSHRASTAAALRATSAGGTAIGPATVVTCVRSIAAPGAIATVDAGAHMLAAMPLWDVEETGEILISSGLATMGFALPAAIAAALARPGRRVYCLVGDGGLGMVLAELETLARLNLPVTVVVFNDSALSLIKIKQRPSGQGGDQAIAYRRTDFAAIARGLGLAAATAADEPELRRALTAINPQSGPLLVDVDVDPAPYPQIMRLCRNT